MMVQSDGHEILHFALTPLHTTGVTKIMEDVSISAGWLEFILTVSVLKVINSEKMGRAVSRLISVKGPPASMSVCPCQMGTVVPALMDTCLHQMIVAVWM